MNKKVKFKGWVHLCRVDDIDDISSLYYRIFELRKDMVRINPDCHCGKKCKPTKIELDITINRI